jgi:hypothetical protein
LKVTKDISDLDKYESSLKIVKKTFDRNGWQYQKYGNRQNSSYPVLSRKCPDHLYPWLLSSEIFRACMHKAT